MKLFSTKVKFTKQQEDGSWKRVSELTLLEAETFGHAEERIYEQMKDVRGEIEVAAIQKKHFDEIYLDALSDEKDNIFAEVKVKAMIFNMDDPKPKQKTLKLLIRTTDFDEIKPLAMAVLKNMDISEEHYSFGNINITEIIDYIPYVENEEDMLDNESDYTSNEE